MTRLPNRALIPLIFLSVLWGPTDVRAQIDQSNVAAELSERVARASEEIDRYRQSGQAALEDSVHLDLANHLFNEYVRRGDTESGRFAVQFAFLHWADAGAAESAMEAVSRIDVDSKAWSLIIRPLRSAISSSDRHDADDVERVLRTLDSSLSDDRSLAAVNLELGELAFERMDTLAAIEAYRKAVELDADSIIVDIALGQLYEIRSLNVNEAAPTFQAETISGELINFDSLRGRIVLLEFWATWCGPCMPEIPYLKEAWALFKEDDFDLIGISLDTNREFLEKTVAEKGITWPQIQEPEAFGGMISKLYNVSGIPRTYLIDRAGKIIAKDFRKGEIIELVRQALLSSDE